MIWCTQWTEWTQLFAKPIRRN